MSTSIIYRLYLGPYRRFYREFITLKEASMEAQKHKDVIVYEFNGIFRKTIIEKPPSKWGGEW